MASLLARSAPSRDRELANALLEREQVLALELDQDVAQQTAEPANVAPERPIDLAAPGGSASRRYDLGAVGIRRLVPHFETDDLTFGRLAKPRLG